jgi:GNAT superfamily N-acetyltransferase
MITIQRAIVDDAEAISALLMANGVEQGGALYGEWSIGVVTGWINSGALIVVATQGSRLIGVLFTSEKAQASAPPVLAMLKAWPGRDDAYIYGPVCVDRHTRGTGVLEALYAEVVRRLPGREAILFINSVNLRSLRAHVKLGFKDVSSFRLEGQEYLVFSSIG